MGWHEMNHILLVMGNARRSWELGLAFSIERVW